LFWRHGVVVIVFASGSEDHGFEKITTIASPKLLPAKLPMYRLTAQSDYTSGLINLGHHVVALALAFPYPNVITTLS
jgi:hypothetical protein